MTLPLGLTAAMVFLMLGVVSAEFVPRFKILCGLLAVAVSAMYAWGLFLTGRGLFRKERGRGRRPGLKREEFHAHGFWCQVHESRRSGQTEAGPAGITGVDEPVRLAAEFGCATIGIQYQQGLKDLTPASDLAEGLLNNVDRPPVYDGSSGRELFAGEAVPHFNEVDECAGLDALITYRLWKTMGFPPERTPCTISAGAGPTMGDGIDDFVWVLEISGAVPRAHFTGGYAGASSERQPPMYFRLGGGTVKGVSRPGHVVWSRVFVAGGGLHYDTGLAQAVSLPASETEERWRLTGPRQWLWNTGTATERRGCTRLSLNDEICRLGRAVAADHTQTARRSRGFV